MTFDQLFKSHSGVDLALVKITTSLLLVPTSENYHLHASSKLALSFPLPQTKKSFTMPIGFNTHFCKYFIYRL